MVQIPGNWENIVFFMVQDIGRMDGSARYRLIYRSLKVARAFSCLYDILGMICLKSRDDYFVNTSIITLALAL